MPRVFGILVLRHRQEPKWQMVEQLLSNQGYRMKFSESWQQRITILQLEWEALEAIKLSFTIRRTMSTGELQSLEKMESLRVIRETGGLHQQLYCTWVEFLIHSATEITKQGTYRWEMIDF